MSKKQKSKKLYLRIAIPLILILLMLWSWVPVTERISLDLIDGDPEEIRKESELAYQENRKGETGHSDPWW